MINKIKQILSDIKEDELIARDSNKDNQEIWKKRDFNFDEIWDEMFRLKNIINAIEKIVQNE